MPCYKKMVFAFYGFFFYEKRQNFHGKVKYRCDVDFASAIKALISRIIDSFFSGASLGTKSRAEIAVLKAFLASVWLPNCVKQEPFLWCSLCARFFGYLYLKANSISWRQSTVTRYYRFGTQTSNAHTLKIIIFSLYFVIVRPKYQNYRQSMNWELLLVNKAFLKFKVFKKKFVK